jgi:hypothetical protein
MINYIDHIINNNVYRFTFEKIPNGPTKVLSMEGVENGKAKPIDMAEKLFTKEQVTNAIQEILVKIKLTSLH